MVKLFIVPEKDWDILKKYLGESGVVLVPQHVYDKLPDNKKEALESEQQIDYDFGGEADVWVDFALSEDAYALTNILEEEA